MTVLLLVLKEKNISAFNVATPTTVVAEGVKRLVSVFGNNKSDANSITFINVMSVHRRFSSLIEDLSEWRRP